MDASCLEKQVDENYAYFQESCGEKNQFNYAYKLHHGLPVSHFAKKSR